jgi:hypothetical protein
VRRTTTEGIESVLMNHLTLVCTAHRALFQQVLILESIFTRRNQSSEKYWLGKNTGSAGQKPVFT